MKCQSVLFSHNLQNSLTRRQHWRSLLSLENMTMMKSVAFFTKMTTSPKWWATRKVSGKPFVKNISILNSRSTISQIQNSSWRIKTLWLTRVTSSYRSWKAPRSRPNACAFSLVKFCTTLLGCYSTRSCSCSTQWWFLKTMQRVQTRTRQMTI